MTREDAFLAAVAENPEDGPRLMYADWLTEHGDASAQGRGEFIRVQCELERTPMDDPRRGALERRERELLAAHEAAWVRRLGKHVGKPDVPPPHWRFHRGFIEWAVVPVETFVKHAAELFRLAPLRCLQLVGS